MMHSTDEINTRPAVGRGDRGPDGPGSRLVPALLLIAFGYLFVFFAFADIEKVMYRVPDDAAYFFRIAENVAAGHGSTFDGIHRTNGYQPLWLVALLPLAALVHAVPETMFRFYLVFQLIVLLAGSWLFYSLHRRLFPAAVGLLSATFFVLVVFYKSANGMESGLVVFMMSLLFYFGRRWRVFERSSAGLSFVFGILLGLTMLARLDLVFLGAAVCGLCAFQILSRWERRQDGLIRLVMILLGAIVTVGPYILYNRFTFGAVLPMSGLLKSSYPQVSFAAYKLRAIGPLHLSFAAFAALYAAWAGYRLKKKRFTGEDERYFAAGMIVLAAGVLLHLGNTLLFIDWGIFRWHFVPYALFASLALSAPAEALLRGRHRGLLQLVVFAFSAVVFVLGTTRVLRQTFLAPVERSWHVHSYRAGLWARAHTEPGDLFAMKDAGRFAYISQRAVVNLDGVVNDFHYQEVLDSRSLNDYFGRLKVKYLVQHGILRGDRNLLVEITGGNGTVHDGRYEKIALRYLCLLYDSHSEPINLARDDEVYKSLAAGGGDARAFVIWKIAGEEAP